MPRSKGGSSPVVTLGLDISSVCVGFAVFHDSDLHTYGKFFQVGKSHGERLMNFAAWLEATFTSLNPDHVVIEMPHGGGRGKAFKILTQYSAMVFMVHFKVFKRELLDSHCMYPISVKKQVGVQTTTDHDQNKAVMVDKINQLFGLSLHFNADDKRKKSTDDDIADAIALVVAWLRRSNRDDGRYDPKPNRRGKRAKKA